MSIYVYNNNGHPQWLPGTIDRQTGPVLYLVKLNDGCTWCRHVDHIRIRTIPQTVTDYDDIVPLTITPSPNQTESPTSISETEQAVPLRRSSWLRKPNPRNTNDTQS